MMQMQELIKKIRESYDNAIDILSEAQLPPAWTEEQERAFGTVRPTLIIGLGGSGTKSVARLKRKLEKFYRGDKFEEHRKVIRFRVLDTLSYEKLLREDPVVCQIISQDDYCYIGGFNAGKDLGKFAIKSRIMNWWDPTYVPPSDTVIDNGAKRVRQLGRLAINHPHIKENVSIKINREIEDAVTLYRNLVENAKTRMPREEETQRIYIYIFSGSCGGTGSGILFDVLHIVLKRIGELDYNPIIRLVIFMPGIFIQIARKMVGGEWLAKAYEANAYAFFKELQHLIINAPDFFRKILPAEEWEDFKEKLPSNWKPQRVYLVDTEISGREISSLDELYTLASEYIFHLITTPIGQEEESAATNIDGRLNTKTRGRPQAFSSFGVSYIIYPSKTYARCLSARLIKDCLDVILKSSLTEGEVKLISKKVNDFATQYQNFLKADNIDEKLLSGTSEFKNIIPDASQILRTEDKISQVMENAEKIQEEQEALGKQKIERNFFDFKNEAINFIKEVLISEINKLNETSLEFVRRFFLELKNRIDEEKKIDFPSPAVAEKNAKGAIENVQKLEKKFLVWKKGEKIRENVVNFVKFLKEETDLEFKRFAAERRNQYLEEVKKNIDEMMMCLRNIETNLGYIKDVMDTESNNFNVDFDESSVTITTQFIPGPPNKETINKLYKESNIEPTRIAREIFSSIQFWPLGSMEEGEFTTFLNEFIKKVSGSAIKYFIPILKKRITEVVKENFKRPEDFKEVYGVNLYSLADPCWKVDLGEILEKEKAFIASFPNLACPDDFPIKDYLPSELHRDPRPGDKRMVVALRSEHAIPLFANRRITMYKRNYLNWLDNFRKQSEAPPHIVKDWNYPEALEDILPEEIPLAAPEFQQAFAIALFLDWLVREKKYEPVLKVLVGKEGWKHTGPIYETERYYRFIKYEPEDEFLRRTAEKGVVLGKGRTVAQSKLDETHKKYIEIFKDKVLEGIKKKELIQLLSEYINFLVDEHNIDQYVSLPPDEQTEKLKNETEPMRIFIKQLLDEIEILKKYQEELKR